MSMWPQQQFVFDGSVASTSSAPNGQAASPFNVAMHADAANMVAGRPPAICRFSSRMANQAADAVESRRFSSIMAWHADHRRQLSDAARADVQIKSELLSDGASPSPARLPQTSPAPRTPLTPSGSLNPLTPSDTKPFAQLPGRGATHAPLASPQHACASASSLPSTPAGANASAPSNIDRPLFPYSAGAPPAYEEESNPLRKMEQMAHESFEPNPKVARLHTPTPPARDTAARGPPRPVAAQPAGLPSAPSQAMVAASRLSPEAERARQEKLQWLEQLHGQIGGQQPAMLIRGPAPMHPHPQQQQRMMLMPQHQQQMVVVCDQNGQAFQMPAELAAQQGLIVVGQVDMEAERDNAKRNWDMMQQQHEIEKIMQQQQRMPLPPGMIPGGGVPYSTGPLGPQPMGLMPGQQFPAGPQPGHQFPAGAQPGQQFPAGAQPGKPMMAVPPSARQAPRQPPPPPQPFAAVPEAQLAQMGMQQRFVGPGGVCQPPMMADMLRAEMAFGAGSFAPDASFGAFRAGVDMSAPEFCGAEPDLLSMNSGGPPAGMFAGGGPTKRTREEAFGGRARQPSPAQRPPPATGPPPPSHALPTVNNTFVNATMSIQQLNIQNVVPPGHQMNHMNMRAGPPHQGPIPMRGRAPSDVVLHRVPPPHHHVQLDPQHGDLNMSLFGMAEPLTNLDAKVPSQKLQYFPQRAPPPQLLNRVAAASQPRPPTDADLQAMMLAQQTVRLEATAAHNGNGVVMGISQQQFAAAAFPFVDPFGGQRPPQPPQ